MHKFFCTKVNTNLFMCASNIILLKIISQFSSILCLLFKCSDNNILKLNKNYNNNA